MRIDPVRERDIPDLVPMMGAYCDFYGVSPGTEKLETLARTLLERPHEGAQFIARDHAGDPAGFATVYWTWNTLVADRVGVLYDLFVRPRHRAHGVGRALVYRCLEAGRDRGVAGLAWDTAPDNATALRLYDSLPGARRGEWVSYWLDA